MTTRRSILAAAVALATGRLRRAAASVPARPVGGAPPERFVERWSWVMGQAVHIMLFTDSEDRGREAAAAALAELRRVESRLSRFDDASDLAEVNRAAGRRAVRVGPDLHATLRIAESVRRSSAGAFDPAIEPLLRIWGLHAARRTPPSRTEVAEARRAVRAARIRYIADRVLLTGTDARIDLGGIGVGYGLDRAGRVLRDHGIVRGLIDVSGDVLAIGAPPGEPGWPVTIPAPGGRGPNRRTVMLRDAAMATSSNLVSTVRLGAMVAGHIVDPSTGRPAARTLQVTVCAASAIRADALATAALVTGQAPGATALWRDYLSPP